MLQIIRLLYSIEVEKGNDYFPVCTCIDVSVQQIKPHALLYIQRSNAASIHILEMRNKSSCQSYATPRRGCSISMPDNLGSSFV